jgi:hypothetical protein
MPDKTKKNKKTDSANYRQVVKHKKFGLWRSPYYAKIRNFGCKTQKGKRKASYRALA